MSSENAQRPIAADKSTIARGPVPREARYSCDIMPAEHSSALRLRWGIGKIIVRVAPHHVPVRNRSRDNLIRPAVASLPVCTFRQRYRKTLGLLLHTHAPSARERSRRTSCAGNSWDERSFQLSAGRFGVFGSIKIPCRDALKMSDLHPQTRTTAGFSRVFPARIVILSAGAIHYSPKFRCRIGIGRRRCSGSDHCSDQAERTSRERLRFQFTVAEPH